MIVTRIFTEAGRNPDIADDLKKMMSYYLPTTKKLLDAYCELDEQPVPGENIETTKQEIAATLDTLNNAFAKLSTICLRKRRGIFLLILACSIRCSRRRDSRKVHLTKNERK